MSNVQSEMQKLVDDFVGNLSSLFRDAVTNALGDGNGNGHRNGHSNGNGRAKGEKRPADELEARRRAWTPPMTACAWAA